MNQRSVNLTVLGLLSVFIGTMLWLSDGYYGGGDSLAHYRLARFSWSHPEYLLDHWGKPFFTLISAPFALLGFEGYRWFNLLCAVLSVIMVFMIARRWNWSAAFVGAPLVLFAPEMLRSSFSGLTEPSFALMLVAAVAWKQTDRRILFLLCLSFLPFIRTEGLLLVAWFGLLDLHKHRDAKPLLLFVAPTVYSIAGWWAKDDVLWLINEMPYTGGEHIYGSGSLLHYVSIMPESLGWPLVIGTSFSLLFALFFFLKNGRAESKSVLTDLWMPIILFVGFHSVMWYLGRVSLGLPRMLAAMVPLMAAASVHGLNSLRPISHRLFIAMAVLTSVWAVSNGLQKVQLPATLDGEDRVQQSVAEFINNEGLKERKIHYYSLYLEHLLNLDPHDPQCCQQVVHNRSHPEEEVVPGGLVIWDAHFAPNEGAMPLENLSTNPHFRELKIFHPDPPFNTLGDRPFRVIVFERKQ